MFWSVLIGTLTLALCADVIFHLVYGRRVLTYFEDSPPFLAPAGLRDPDAKCIDFPAHDGLTLRGAIVNSGYVNPRGLLVFCPETKADFWSYQAYVTAAASAGFDVLSFDFRNQGFSDHDPTYQPLHWLTQHEVDDLDATVSFARSLPKYRNVPLVLHGVSRGAGAALAVAARRSDVAGVAIQGAFSYRSLTDYYVRKWKKTVLARLNWLIPDWHNRITMWVAKQFSQRRRGARYVNIESALPRLQNRPLLWMATQRDSCVPREVTDELFQMTGHRDADLWVVPRGRHNGERLAAPEEFDRRLVEFLTKIGRPKSLGAWKDSGSIPSVA